MRLAYRSELLVGRGLQPIDGFPRPRVLLPAAPAAAASPIQGPGRSPSGPLPPSQANAGLSGFLQGLPIAGPYVLPGMQRLTAWGQSQATGQPYDQALSAIQGYGDRSASAYPGTALAGNIAGGVAGTVPMMAAAPAAFGVGVANPLVAGLSSGVTGAALYGADGEPRSDGTPRRLAKVRLSAGLSAESRLSRAARSAA